MGGSTNRDAKSKRRKKKSYFGALKGIGPYKHEKFSDFD